MSDSLSDSFKKNRPASARMNAAPPGNVVKSILSTSSVLSSKSNLQISAYSKTSSSSTSLSGASRPFIQSHESSNANVDSKAKFTLETNMQALGFGSITTSSLTAITPSLNITSNVNSITPATAFKLCKKIAQLTKVIYYLNTKSEDHDTVKASLADLYEAEIDAVLLDANSRLSNLQNKAEIDKQDLQLFSQEMEELKALLSLEKATTERLQKQYDALKSEASLTAAHKEALSTKLKVQEKETLSKLEALNDSHQMAVTSLTDNFKAQSEELSERYKRLEDEHQETLKVQQAELQRFQAEISAMGQRQMQQMHSLEQSLTADKQEQAEKFNDQLIKVQSQLSQARLELGKSSTEIERLRQDLSSKTAFMGTVERKLTESTALNLSLEASNAQLTKRSEELRQRGEQMSCEIEKLNKLVLNAQMERDEKTLSLQEQARQIKFLEQKLEECTGRLSASEQLEKLAESERDSLKQQLCAMEEQLQELQRQRDKGVKLEKEYAQRIKELQETHEVDLRSSLDKLEEDLSREHLEDLKRSKDLLKVSLESMETRLITAEAEGKQTLAQAAQEHQKEIEELRESMQLVEIEYKNEVKLLRSAKAHLQQEGLKLQTQVHELETQVEALNSTIINSKEGMKTLLSEKEKMDSSFKEKEQILKKHWEDVLFEKERELELRWEAKSEAAVKSALLSQESQLQSQFDQQLFKKSERHDSDIALLKKTHRDEIAKVQKLWEDTREQLLETQKNFQSLELRYTDLEARFECDMSELNQRLTLERVNRLKELEERLTSKHANELKSLEETYQVQITEARQSQSKVVDEVKRSQLLTILALKKDAEALRNSEIAQIQSTHQRELAATREEAKVALQQEISRLEASQAVMIEEYTRKLAMERSEGAEKIEKLQSDVTQLNTLVKNMEQFVDDLETKVRDARDELEKKEVTIEGLKFDMVEQLKQKEKSLKELFQQDVSKLTKQHYDETQKMIQEFGQAQQCFKQTISKMEQKLKDADYKYEHRDPRKEDLEKIAALEEEIKRRKQKTQSLIEEADYYRLELTNREANFNKIFCKQPLVGVMNPAEFSTAPTGTRGISVARAKQDPNLKRKFLNSLVNGDSKSESSLVSKLPPITMRMSHRHGN